MGFYAAPEWVKWVFKLLLKASGNKRLAKFLNGIQKLNDEDLGKLYKRRLDFQEKFMESWKASGISALVLPPFVHCAFQSKNAAEVGSLYDYIFLWNMLHFPSGIVPVTEVLAGEDKGYDDGFNDMITKSVREDMAGSQGMPLGVQVVAAPWDDEVALAVMKDIDEVVNYQRYAKDE